MWDLKKLFFKNKIPSQRFYLTSQGLEDLKKQYEYLKELKLSKIKGETPKFLQSDDLNPEYFDFQDDLSLLEARIEDIEYILKSTELIKLPSKQKQDIIQLGATVAVEVGGADDELTIVGTLEANPTLGKISNESPVGQALLGHRVGEEITISSPIKTHYKIKKIKYLRS